MAWESLPRDVRAYEPRLALHAGSNGTEILERILGTAVPFLSADGILLLEIGEEQADLLRERAEQQERIHSVRVFPDFAGKPRVLAAGRSALPA
jgi:release factor glutamine methyltransferase